MSKKAYTIGAETQISDEKVKRLCDRLIMDTRIVHSDRTCGLEADFCDGILASMMKKAKAENGYIQIECCDVDKLAKRGEIVGIVWEYYDVDEALKQVREAVAKHSIANMDIEPYEVCRVAFPAELSELMQDN